MAVEQSTGEENATVDPKLVDLLNKEADEMNAWNFKSWYPFWNEAGDSVRCPACPFREFGRIANAKHHIRVHHTEYKRWCPSGILQLKVCCAMFDNDVMSHAEEHPNYMRRSAELMREQLNPDCTSARRSNLSGHGEVKVLFSETGPRLASHAALQESQDAFRITTQVFATKGFFTFVFREIILSKGSFRTATSSI